MKLNGNRQWSSRKPRRRRHHMAIEQQHTNGTLSDAKQRVSAMFPGAVEMPDQSGAPSADYCIMRPATKEDWPKNKWVQVGPYVSGNPWEAALERIDRKSTRLNS